jgi:hypothetical protein
MPSIPQSLLWISLVVLWLFVLVPMLISKRENVRRTSDVALATRVLNGGARGARLLRKRGPAAGHHSDPHWRHSQDVDDVDEYEGDDDVTAPRKTVVLAAAAVSTEPDYLDVDVVEEDSGALPVGASAVQSELMLDLELDDVEDEVELPEEVDDVVEEVVAEDEVREFDDSTAAIRTVSEVDFEPDDLDNLDELEGLDADDDEDPDTDSYEPVAPDGTEHDYEYVDDSSGLEAVSETEPQLADSMAQARRNRYESKTAAAVSARKYRFRKNMLMVMGVAMVATAVVAYVVTPAMWWACGSVGAVTLLYLGYLRRQTRIEEQVRRRRAQRMARSRLGVENTHDGEFDVVPARLRRPGSVVLEIDDEDPIFEHLDYATSEEYYLAQAAGQ